MSDTDTGIPESPVIPEVVPVKKRQRLFSIPQLRQAQRVMRGVESMKGLAAGEARQVLKIASQEMPKTLAKELYQVMRAERMSTLTQLLEKFERDQLRPKTFLRGYMSVLIEQSMQLEIVASHTLNPETMTPKVFLQEYIHVMDAQGRLLREIRQTIRDLQYTGTKRRLPKHAQGLLDQLADGKK